MANPIRYERDQAITWQSTTDLAFALLNLSVFMLIPVLVLAVRESALRRHLEAELAARPPASSVPPAPLVAPPPVSPPPQRVDAIDRLLGVRRSIVEALRRAFAATGSPGGLTVDGRSGDLKLSAAILFDEGSAEIRPEAQVVLETILQRYLGVLFGTFRPSISQLVIAGHTNDNGSYGYNMLLSTRRALAIADFLHRMHSPFRADLERCAATMGCSTSQLITDAAGVVDKSRSRRIEFSFRLRDEESVSRVRSVLEK